jgi:hypothetical protein
MAEVGILVGMGPFQSNDLFSLLFSTEKYTIFHSKSAPLSAKKFT